MWKRNVTWSRIRRILELEQQSEILKATNYKLRMELLVANNRVGALNELLQKEKQGRPTWNGGAYDGKPSSTNSATRKGTEEVTEQTEEGTKKAKKESPQP